MREVHGYEATLEIGWVHWSTTKTPLSQLSSIS